MGTLQALELLCVAGAEKASDLFPGLASYLCSEGFVLRLFQLLRGVERGWEILKKYPPSIFIQGKNSCTWLRLERDLFFSMSRLCWLSLGKNFMHAHTLTRKIPEHEKDFSSPNHPDLTPTQKLNKAIIVQDTCLDFTQFFVFRSRLWNCFLMDGEWRSKSHVTKDVPKERRGRGFQDGVPPVACKHSHSFKRRSFSPPWVWTSQGAETTWPVTATICSKESKGTSRRTLASVVLLNPRSIW